MDLGFVWAETLGFGLCLNVGLHLLCSFPFGCGSYLMLFKCGTDVSAYNKRPKRTKETQIKVNLPPPSCFGITDIYIEYLKYLISRPPTSRLRQDHGNESVSRQRDIARPTRFFREMILPL